MMSRQGVGGGYRGGPFRGGRRLCTVCSMVSLPGELSTKDFE